MKNSIVKQKLTAFAAAVLLCCSVLFIQSNARAQCPSASYPPMDACDGTSWGGPYSGTTELYGTTCMVNFTYCKRSCFEADHITMFTECYPESVSPIPGSDCVGLSNEQMILLLIRTFTTTGIAGAEWFAPPMCSLGTYQTVEYFVPDCWKEEVDSGGNPTYYVCDDSAYCSFTTSYCNTLTAGLSTSTTENSYGTADCAAVPFPDIWVIGTCYNITPCGH
jgi:hypothetical protein